MDREKLDRIPDHPGVYLMHDADDNVIYVGKANSLIKRVRSYFDRGHDSPRLQALVRKVEQIETILVDSEKEALLLEINLIKEHQPRYNVLLKDDKKYPFVKVTLGDLYPRVFATRLVEEDGSLYFGPYTDVKGMKRVLKLIHQLFPVRTCTYRFPTKTPVRLCLDYQIGRCLGPCEDKISREDYRKMVDRILLLLKGKTGALMKELKGEMDRAAEEHRYEAAAIYRDQLTAINRMSERQRITSGDGADRDVIAIAGEGRESVAVLMRIREGKMGGKEVFPIEAGAERDQAGALLKRLYRGSFPVPREIVCDREVEDRVAIGRWLSELKGSNVKIVVPKRGEKKRIVDLVRANAEHEHRTLLLRKMARKDHTWEAIRQLQRELELPLIPRRIECFDISNLGDRDLVGSSVCFLDGLPEKSRYRRYKIKSVRGVDDYASMNEVVARRFRRLLREGDELPDLVVIDGGKGQLSSALAALREVNAVDVPLISLAKRLEEVFRPGFSRGIILPEGPALLLLQRIRDEAHRFAIGFQRKRRGAGVRRSELDDIPGVGPTRKRALLQTFGSVRMVRLASLEMLAGADGIGLSLARTIHRHFHPEQGGEVAG